MNVNYVGIAQSYQARIFSEGLLFQFRPNHSQEPHGERISLMLHEAVRNSAPYP
jgi:hypothetical protein